MAKKTDKTRAAGATPRQKTLTVSDERLLTLLEGIDRTLGEARCTTTEMILVARMMTVTATAQLCEDNPKADPIALVKGITDDLRQALTARVLQAPGYTAPAFCPMGEA